MNILLVNPPYINLSGIRDSGGHSLPLNLAYLAAYVRKHMDCSISVMDAETPSLTFEGIRERLIKEKPDVLGITCPTPLVNYVVRIAGMAKELNSGTIVVVGGPHASVFPEEMAKIGCIDLVVRGEGEVSFLEIVKTISSGERTYRNIDGIAYKSGDKVVVTPEREFIKDLDEIPFPARDLFDLEAYHSAVTKKVSSFRATSIMTARGCPYDCIHCISKLTWKRRVRYRSINSIVDEMEECVKKYGLREFNIYDETFTIDKKRVIGICREIVRRDLKIFWICFGRVNVIDKEMVEEMKKSGCKKISFGLESGSQKLLDIMRKSATLDMARKAVKIVNEAGIEVHASFMLGNVGEDTGTVRESIDFAKSLKLDNATFFITAPFPGTDLYKIAQEKGYINENTKWEHFAPITKSSPVLVQDNLSQEELVKWQKKAFREFYVRPKYILQKLLCIKSFDDVKKLIIGLGVFFRVQKKQAG